jgi:ubiquinone/menaquinone biosynthesis C-methylase UbiE
MTVWMAIKLAHAAAGSIEFEEQRQFVQKRLHDVPRGVAVQGDTILAEIASIEHAHRSTVKLQTAIARAQRQVDGFRIGIASTGQPTEAKFEASQLANAASPGEAIVSSSVWQGLAARSRARYLPVETIAGYKAYRSLPRGTRRCFLITPIGAPDSEDRRLSEYVFHRIVAEACKRLSPPCLVVHPLDQSGADIWADVANALFSADHVIAFLGKHPWNPNVMVEVGYRLATGKPLVILAPEGRLPFDLQNRRTIMLPPDPQTMSADALAKAIDDVVELLGQRESYDLGWGDLRPTATIEIDLRDVPVKDHRIGDASEQTARLFNLQRPDLIGVPPEELMTHLLSLMDRWQYDKFIEEQSRLYGDPTVLSSSVQPVQAEIPIVLTKHPDPEFFCRAYLPAILTHQRIDDRLLIRVVYVDVSRYAKLDPEGICRMPRPGPNLDFLFSQYATAYDAVLPKLPNYAETVKRHLDLLAARQGMRILDFGAGTGNLTLPLLESGATVTAVDRNEAMLDRLQEKCRDHAARLETYQEDATDLSRFANDCFDAVNILLVLFTTEQPDRLLREAWRVLRPGGQLVITEPSMKFDLGQLLDDSEQQLRKTGDLASVASQWETVKRVNLAFDAALKDSHRAERIRTVLTDLAGRLPRAWPAYGGHCLTLAATKPGAAR